MTTNRFPLKAHRFNEKLFRCFCYVDGKRIVFYGKTQTEAEFKAYLACAEEKQRYDSEHKKDRFIEFFF